MRRPDFLSRTLLVVALEAAIGMAGLGAADDAALIARLGPHLRVERADERCAALRVAIAAGDDALTNEVVNAYQMRGAPTVTELQLLAQVISDLAPERQVDLAAGPSEALAQAACESLAQHPDRVAALLQPTGQLAKATGALRESLIARALRHCKQEEPIHGTLLLLRAHNGGSAEHLEHLRDATDAELDEDLVRSVASDPAPAAQLAAIARLVAWHLGIRPPWHRAVLLDLVAATDVNVRVASIKALSIVARAPLSAEEDALLLQLLTDPNPRNRSSAFIWAQTSGTVLTEAQTLAGLNDSDSLVQCAVPLWRKDAITPAVAVKLESMCVKDQNYIVGLDGVARTDKRHAADLADQLGMAKDSKSVDVYSAMNFLARMKDPRVTEVAGRMMTFPDEIFRDDARRFLATSGAVDTDSSALVSMSRGDAASEGGDRRQLLEQLVSLEPAERMVRMQALFGKQPVDVKLRFLNMMVHEDASGFAREFAVSCIADPDPRVATEAMQSLSNARNFYSYDRTHQFLGADVVMTRVDDPDPAVSTMAMAYIHQLCLPSLERALAAKAASAAALHARPGAIADPQSGRAPRPAAIRGSQLYDDALSLDLAALLKRLPTTTPEALPDLLLEIAKCDDPAALPALHAACHNPVAAVRFTAHLGLLLHGDQSEETLDFAIAWLAGMNPSSWKGQPLPIIDGRLFARLGMVQGASAATVAALSKFFHDQADDAAHPHVNQMQPPTPASAPTPVAWSPATEPGTDAAPAVRAGQRDHLEAVSWRPGNAAGPWEVPTISHPQNGAVLRIACAGSNRDLSSIELPLPQAIAGRTLHLRVRGVSGACRGVSVGLMIDQPPKLFLTEAYLGAVVGQESEHSCRIDSLNFLPAPGHDRMAVNPQIRGIVIHVENHREPAVVDVLELSVVDAP